MIKNLVTAANEFTLIYAVAIVSSAIIWEAVFLKVKQ